MNDATRTAENETDISLSIDGLHVSYENIIALRDIELNINEGSFTAIIGPNGAGKSTLADTITGFKDYNQGSVQFRNIEVRDMTPSELVAEGLIYCTESKDIFDYMSVKDNLTLGAYNREVDIEQQCSFVYDIFPRLEERKNQTAQTMSGGEQQMLAIGRALMGDPDFLILDEPSLGLAPVVLEDISRGIDQIQSNGITMLLFEQNITFALDHADYVYLMENGKIEKEGTPDEMADDKYVQDAYIGQ